MENQNGLVVGVRLTQTSGTAECEAAIDMMDDVPGTHPITLGADKAYDNENFVQQVRERGGTPRVAENDKNRRSAIDGRTTRHHGYATVQRKRKRVEEIFGWAKTIGGMRKTRAQGDQARGMVIYPHRSSIQPRNDWQHPHSLTANLPGIGGANPGDTISKQIPTNPKSAR